MNPTRVIRKAYYDLLSLNLRVDFGDGGQLVAVYDRVPSNAVFPYVKIGEITVTSDDDEAQATFDAAGYIITILLDVVTKFDADEGGSLHAELIADEIYRLNRQRPPYIPVDESYVILATTVDSDNNLEELTDNNSIFRRLIRFRHIMHATS